MDDKLTKLFNEFCKLKDELNTSNVTEKTVNIVGRFGKAVRGAENIVLDPPVRDTYFDPELHLKACTYAPLKKEDGKDLKKPTSRIDELNQLKKIAQSPLKKAPQKRGPKPKK